MEGGERNKREREEQGMEEEEIGHGINKRSYKSQSEFLSGHSILRLMSFSFLGARD